MNNKIHEILLSFGTGSISIEQASQSLAALYAGDMDFARLDFHRAERTGYPEVIYCAGKTFEQAEKIIMQMKEREVPVFATKVAPALAEALCRRYPDAQYDKLGKTLGIGEFSAQKEGLVVIAAAGTSDLEPATEAARTAEFFGSNVKLICDIGVAGIHRLFSNLDQIRKARVIIACAGMEGALAGVLAGLVAVPVIALPTSVGYGASFQGISALLGMLTSCAPGISVVNIDNGFGAGYQANLINRGKQDD